MKRLLYIDNLRIFLIALVILHHLLITYGGPGGWYYKEVKIDGPEILLYAMFLASNQSFFMAMFFLISAFFMVPSFKRKGAAIFVKDRLIRLGIPTAIFYFFLNPLTNFTIRKMRNGIDLNFFQYWWETKAFGFGPMWFVEALLLFTLIYVAFQYLTKKSTTKHKQIPLPGTLKIVLLAIALGFITFIVRIWLPVGWVLDPLGFQFPHFVQYIALFIIGIAAFHNKWFDQLTFRNGIRWFWFAQLNIFIVFPFLFMVGGALEHGEGVFIGGFTWQSLSYAIWEQLNGFALIIGLSAIFKKRLNKQGKIAQSLSASAYTAYIIHTPLLVYITLDLSGYHLHPIVKFLAIAPIALFIIFTLSDLIRRLPLIGKIL